MTRYSVHVLKDKTGKLGVPLTYEPNAERAEEVAKAMSMSSAEAILKIYVVCFSEIGSNEYRLHASYHSGTKTAHAGYRI